MVKKTGPTNYQLQMLLNELGTKAVESGFWKRIVKDLKSKKRIVNLYKIDKYAQDGEMIVVPGKVLSVGEISKKIDVAALHFSENAKKKINAAKGKTFSIRELFEKNPEGKKVRILG